MTVVSQRDLTEEALLLIIKTAWCISVAVEYSKFFS